MIKQGMSPVYPHHKDNSLLHSFGALDFDTGSLPDSFSIYDGRTIPNQNDIDERFTPPVRPLPMGCTAETTTFMAGLEDGAQYPPDDFYFATPPGQDGAGRDIRVALSTAATRGFKLPDGTIGAKRAPYFNCYGAGKIDDFDAARIALWINQQEKRGVSVGTYWYWGGTPNNTLVQNGLLVTPSFNTTMMPLHNWFIVGWSTPDVLIGIPWAGMEFGLGGLVYITRADYNRLMTQPWTGAFTQGKLAEGQQPVTIGMQAYYDHIVYALVQFIHQLWGV